MNFNSVTRLIGRLGLTLKKHTPEIMTAVGVVSIGYGTYRVVKDARKIEPILEETKEKVDELHQKKDDPSYPTYGKDMAGVYFDAAKKVGKILLPGVGSIFGGTLCLVSAVRKLKGETNKLEDMVAIGSANMARFRKNVEDEVGKEKADDLYFGRRKKEVELRGADENGNETVELRSVDYIDPNAVPVPTYLWYEDSFDYYYDYGNVKRELADVRDFQKKLCNDLEKWGYLTAADILKRLGYNQTIPNAFLRLGIVFDPLKGIEDQMPFTTEVVELATAPGGNNNPTKQFVRINLNVPDDVYATRNDRRRRVGHA